MSKKFIFNPRTHNIEDIISFIIEKVIKNEQSVNSLGKEHGYDQGTVYVWNRKKTEILNTFLTQMSFDEQIKIMDNFTDKDFLKFSDELLKISNTKENFAETDKKIMDNFTVKAREFIENYNEILDKNNTDKLQSHDEDLSTQSKLLRKKLTRYIKSDDSTLRIAIKNNFDEVVDVIIDDEEFLQKILHIII